MATFADFTVDPGGPIAWLFVGLIAGLLASRVMGGGKYGLIGDIVVGLLGGYVGGYIFGAYISSHPSIAEIIIVAFLGACVLIGVYRLVSPARR